MPIRYRPHVLLVALALLSLGAPAQAQETTFTVTLATKTSAHPYNGMGHPAGFVIDGTEANVLTLARGETYTFQMQDIPSIHPFYISTSDVGGCAEPFTEGVTNNGATGDETLTFTVPMTAPDQLWYQCQVHQFMGWQINVVDATDAEDETLPRPLALDAAFPNPSVGTSALNLRLDRTAEVRAEVFDQAGRRVALLREGVLAAGLHRLTLDAAGLSGGTYVVRVTADGQAVARLVTLVR